MLEMLSNILHLIFSESFILTVVTASTPLLLASSGELVVERSGVLNLGVEGMMIVGAACGFAGAYLSGSIAVGALCGIAAGAALSMVFGILTLGLAVNQVATGLALTIFGIGLSGLIGAKFVGEKIVPAAHLELPVLTDIPGVGHILFGRGRLRLCLGRADHWHLAVSLPHAGGTGVAGGRRQSHLGACARLSGTAHSNAGGDVRRRLRRTWRRLSAARLHAILHSRHDVGPRLDRAGARGFCLVAAGPAGHRRLSVWRREHPWACFATAAASVFPSK